MTNPKVPSKRRPPRTVPKKWQHADERSHGSSSADRSIHTPTSVHVQTPEITRTASDDEVSDLSGSYMNGNVPPRVGANVPKTVYPSDQSATSYERQWRQARLLSPSTPARSKPFAHPQPNDEESVGVVRRPTVMFDSEGFVEVMHAVDSIDNSRRVPLTILLMDPGHKVYELMQLWVDKNEDSVRDIVLAIQQNLSERWRQDYDGLFQVRNNHFDQLIHILHVNKYDVINHEMLVAKPWAMSAKATVAYASGLLNHLKATGILCYNTDETGSPRSSRKAEESVLVLSEEAKRRIYIPGDVMTHYHACQFLSFSPSFEPTRIDVLAGNGDDASQLSDPLSTSTENKNDTETRDKSIPSVRNGESRQVSVDMSSTNCASDTSAINFRLTRNRNIEATFQPNASRKVSEAVSFYPVTKPIGKTVVENRLNKIFSALNCGKKKNRNNVSFESSQTLLSDGYGGSSSWKIFEDGSVVSDSRPLLFASPQESLWRAEL